MIHQVHICTCADMITWRWWDTSGATDDLVLDWEVDKEQMLFSLVTKCKYSDERLIRAFQIVAPSIIIQSGPIRSSPPQCNAQTSLFTHRRRMHCHLSAILKPTTLKVTFFSYCLEKKNPTRKMLMDSSCVLQVGRTNGYIGLAFSYTDLPIGTVVQAQLYSFWTRTSYLKSNINCDWYQMALLRGLMLMESLTVQIYIWTMQVLSLGCCFNLWLWERNSNAFPRCGKEEVPFGRGHKEKYRSAGFHRSIPLKYIKGKLQISSYQLT